MKQLVYFIIALFLTASVYGQDTINQTDANGKKQGFWKKTAADGKKLYEGHFKNGKPCGEFHYYYDDGVTKAVSQFSADGRTTMTRAFFPNGKPMAEGRFVDEKREGLWKFYSEQDGALISEENYRNGKKEGVAKNFFPGQGVAELSNFRDGIHEGTWEQYYADGKVKFRCTYKNDMKEGPVTGYSASGKVLMNGTYKNGSPDGLWTYFDEKGKVTKKETYERGLLIKKEGELEKDDGGPK